MSKIFYFSFLSLFILVKPINFDVLTNNGDSILKIFSNGKLSNYFDYNGQNTFSCQVPDVFHMRAGDAYSSSEFEIHNNDQNTQYKLNIGSIVTDKNVANPTFTNNWPLLVGSGSTTVIVLNYNCDKYFGDADLFYTNVDITLEILDYNTEEVIDKMEFSYIKLCRDIDYLEYKFDYSLIIIVIFVAIFVYLALMISKVMSQKKRTVSFSINFVKAFLYFIALIPMLLLLNYVYSAFIIIYKVVIAIVAFCSFVFFSNQFLSNLFIRSSINRVSCTIPKIGFQITLFMIIGALIGVAFIIPWSLTNNWILSDVITLIIYIAVINVLKVNKFKNCVFIMIMQMLIDILWMILFNYVFNSDYDTSKQYIDDRQYNDYFSSKLTLPMKIECFYINPKYNLNSKCSWISISNLIIPSLFISYFNRYDNHVNATIYSIISFIAYYFGLIIWISIQSKITIILPLSIFCYTLMCLSCLILSVKRNEQYEIWNGLFPDLGLEEAIMKSQDLMESSKDKEKEKDKNNPEVLGFGDNGAIPEGKSVSLSVKNQGSLRNNEF